MLDDGIIQPKGIDLAQFVTYSVLAGLSSILAIPPLILEIKERNLPLAALFSGFMLVNLFNFVNAILWHDSDPSTWWDGTGLCDVEVKLYLGISQLILGAVASIFKQLASILHTTNGTGLYPPSGWQRRRQVVFEWIFCIIFPCILMFLHYWVQPFRYFIFVVAGCQIANGISWHSVILLQSLPIITCGISLWFGILTICRLLTYRRQVSSVLAGSQSAVSKARFTRLFMLSFVVVMVRTPLVLLTVMETIDHQLQGGDLVSELRSSDRNKLKPRVFLSHIQPDRWIQVVSGMLMFFAFGLVENARIMYSTWAVELGVVKFYRQVRTRLWPRSTIAVTAEARSIPDGVHLREIRITDLNSPLDINCVYPDVVSQ